MPFMNNQIEEILSKLARNEASNEEKQAFYGWLNTLNEEEYKRILNQYEVIVLQTSGEERNMMELKQRIENRIEVQRKQNRLIYLKALREAAAVAVILLFAIAGSLYFINIFNNNKEFIDNAILITSRYGDDVLPGSDKAILTLSDGERIILDDFEEGEIKLGNGIRVQKTGEGEVAYDFSPAENKPSVPVTLNTISTPKGGEYKVTLPDGSMVWLNSESSITCPTVFNENERMVQVSGEVYFEVVKMISEDNAQKIPFIVQTENLTIKVLGTQFNVKAYADMEQIETTLLEGQVVIHTPLKEVLMVPGEQAQVGINGEVDVTDDVDLAKIIAWKNGYFQFSDDGIEDIMNQMIRWYDVDIEYKGSKVKTGFGGQIARSKNISEVLRMLELTGEVHFRIDERTIEVYGGPIN